MKTKNFPQLFARKKEALETQILQLQAQARGVAGKIELVKEKLRFLQELARDTTPTPRARRKAK